MSKSRSLFEQVLSVERDIQDLGITQTIAKCFGLIKANDRKAACFSFLGLQYLLQSLHFHEPEFGTGEAIAYALYNIDKPRLKSLREHYIAFYGENTIRNLQKCVDASFSFLSEAILIESEFGWAYYWRASVHRFMLEMDKGKTDLQKAKEFWWDDDNMHISEIDNYINVLSKEDMRLDEEFINLAKNADTQAAAMAFPLVQKKAKQKIFPLIESLNINTSL